LLRALQLLRNKRHLERGRPLAVEVEKATRLVLRVAEEQGESGAFRSATSSHLSVFLSCVTARSSCIGSTGVGVAQPVSVVESARLDKLRAAIASAYLGIVERAVSGCRSASDEVCNSGPYIMVSVSQRLAELAENRVGAVTNPDSTSFASLSPLRALASKLAEFLCARAQTMEFRSVSVCGCGMRLLERSIAAGGFQEGENRHAAVIRRAAERFWPVLADIIREENNNSASGVVVSGGFPIRGLGTLARALCSGLDMPLKPGTAAEQARIEIQLALEKREEELSWQESVQLADWAETEREIGLATKLLTKHRLLLPPSFVVYALKNAAKWLFEGDYGSQDLFFALTELTAQKSRYIDADLLITVAKIMIQHEKTVTGGRNINKTQIFPALYPAIYREAVRRIPEFSVEEKDLLKGLFKPSQYPGLHEWDQYYTSQYATG